MLRVLYERGTQAVLIIWPTVLYASFYVFTRNGGVLLRRGVGTVANNRATFILGRVRGAL